MKTKTRKRIEIEAKFPLLNPDETIKKLNTVGKKTESNIIQNDTYYTPTHKNFLEAKPITEWLRIRKTNTDQTINYKNFSQNGKINKMSCKEIEVGIDDESGIKEILKGLDFKPIIIVEKTRNTWEYKNILISLDIVKNLGNYIELELKSNDFENEEESQNYITEIIEELNIKVGKQIFAGYPQLVMEKNEL